MSAEPIAAKPQGQQGLGELENDYGLPAGCFAVMLIFGAAAAVGGYLLLQRVSGSFGYFTAVACLVGGPLVFGFAFRLRRVRLMVFREGMVWDRRGAAPFVCRWDGIDSLWENLTEVVPLDRVGNSYWKGDITIGKADGWRVRLTDQDLLDAEWNIHALRERILAETQGRLMEQAMEAFGQGRMVKFGRVALGAEGLHDGNGVTPWSEIASMGIEGAGGPNPVLVIRKEGNWLVRTRIHPSEIANRRVFLTLADTCITGQRNSEAKRFEGFAGGPAPEPGPRPSNG